MKILLVAATQKEINKKDFLEFDILISGVGMINTTYNLTKILSKKRYDLVINMGIAGSFNPSIKIGDSVEVIEDTFSEIGFEEDNKFMIFDEFELKNTFSIKPKTILRKANAITVNTVHGEKKSILKIIERLSPDIETMEGASCFMVCEQFQIPCIQIRTISNKIEVRRKQDWDIDLAISNLNNTVRDIINKL